MCLDWISHSKRERARKLVCGYKVGLPDGPLCTTRIVTAPLGTSLPLGEWVTDLEGYRNKRIYSFIGSGRKRKVGWTKQTWRGYRRGYHIWATRQAAQEWIKEEGLHSGHKIYRVRGRRVLAVGKQCGHWVYVCQDILVLRKGKK